MGTGSEKRVTTTPLKRPVYRGEVLTFRSGFALCLSRPSKSCYAAAQDFSTPSFRACRLLLQNLHYTHRPGEGVGPIVSC